MKKYWTIFKIALANTAAYRAHAVIWVLFDILLLGAMPFILLNIYDQQGAIGSLTREQIISYYFTMVIFTNLVWMRGEYEASREIRDGRVSNYLVMPFSYIVARFLHEVAWQIVRSAIFIIPFCIFLIFGHQFLITPSMQSILFSPLILLGSAIILFLIGYIVALTAFWIEENSASLALLYLISALVSGYYLPISLYPSWLLHVTRLLPWQYAVFEPIQMLTSKSYPVAVLLLQQLCWIGLLYIVYRIVWHFGVKKYSAIGR